MRKRDKETFWLNDEPVSEYEALCLLRNNPGICGSSAYLFAGRGDDLREIHVVEPRVGERGQLVDLKIKYFEINKDTSLKLLDKGYVECAVETRWFGLRRTTLWEKRVLTPKGAERLAELEQKRPIKNIAHHGVDVDVRI